MLIKAALLHKKHFFVSSMLKTVVLPIVLTGSISNVRFMKKSVEQVLVRMICSRIGLNTNTSNR